MRTYMPGPHAAFLRDITATALLRQYVEANTKDTELFAAYNDAVATLSAFRDKHIQLVTRYIIVPSRTRNLSAKLNEVDLAAKLTRTTNDAKQELIGTGGTTLVPFLQQSRDETKAAAVAA
jgi:indoleamine 2,3-dioxygenase